MTTYNNPHKILLAAVFLIFSTGLVAQTNAARYIFIGHCYQFYTAGDKVDYRLEEFDFSGFDGVWLGGDVCSEAMLNYTTVQYIDTLFDLGNPETHWSLGNHDARNGNWEWYEEFTGRKTYYAYSSHGITRVVMNTNIVPANCEMLNEQYQIISNVCDTISAATDLILIMHHDLWRDVPGLPPPGTYAQSDLIYWNANCDSADTRFVETIYPKLVAVRQRGINVTCILGDMGATWKKFDMFSDDGIRFMGCGLYDNSPEDNVLFIEKEIESAPLTFSFHNLDSLLNVQRVQ
jgi:3',5'-cyclic AMP phosphodiesterase CpdA